MSIELTEQEREFIAAVLMSAPYTGKPEDLRAILALVDKIVAKLKAE